MAARGRPVGVGNVGGRGSLSGTDSNSARLNPARPEPQEFLNRRISGTGAEAGAASQGSGRMSPVSAADDFFEGHPVKAEAAAGPRRDTQGGGREGQGGQGCLLP